MKRIWLDDIRPIPPGYTHWAKTADECIELLKAGDCEHISLDHDLADEHYHGTKPAREAYKEKTGMHVVLWMVENNIWPEDIRIHTMSPIGRSNMALACEKWSPDGTKITIAIAYSGIQKPYTWGVD